MRGIGHTSIEMRAPPKVLQPAAALAALSANLPATADNFLAFYSSALGGIVTDPTYFVVAIDDHMTHRGHAGRPCTYSNSHVAAVSPLTDRPFHCGA